jgi:hypothetical protein
MPHWVVVSDVYCKTMMIQAMMSTQRNIQLTTKAAATRNTTVMKTATRTTHTAAGEETVHEAAAVLVPPMHELK